MKVSVELRKIAHSDPPKKKNDLARMQAQFQLKDKKKKKKRAPFEPPTTLKRTATLG
jgi:hypothetical protein